MEKMKQSNKIIAIFLVFIILFSVFATPISIAAEVLNSTYYKIDNSNKMISRVEPETKVEEFKTKMNAQQSEIKIYQDKTCQTEVTTGFVGTGMVAKYDGIVYEISVVGDFDKDGKATQVELTNIIRYIVGLTGSDLKGIYYESADITGDGLVDQRDITKYIRYIVFGELDLGKVDTTPPILTLKAEDIQANTAKVVATAIDKETGMGDNPTYIFYLKKAGEPDTSYVEAQKGTNNVFNLTNLISNTEYEVKVVTHDKAGNKAEETIKIKTKNIQGTLTFSKETWNSGKASIDITSTTDYVIEYQINSNTGTWTTGTAKKVTLQNLNHNDIIYARLTDGSTQTAEQTKQIKDYIPPTIVLSLTKDVSEISVTATATDNETGIASTEEYVFYLDGVEKQRSTSNTCNFTGLTADTNYKVKVEIKDKAGNIGIKEQTISTGSLPDVTQTGVLTFGAVTWNGGKASTTISTNTTFTIEYQVNSYADGGWTTIANGGAVTNLNNNDVVYARLTDGINTSNTTSVTIKDLVNPTITSNLTSTTSEATVVATSADNETGIAPAEEYVYYIKEAGGTYVEKHRNTSGTYKFTGLTADKNYMVKIEIKDIAGNIGVKEQSITTKNVPSASQPGNIMFSSVIWTNGKAQVTITTNTTYTIEYQVNGTANGAWITGTAGLQNITVQNLKHNDVIYARLTDGTNSGSYISQTICDAISPNVTLNLVDGTQQITATATATDNESGIPTNVTYKFSIKETGANDSTYVEKQNTTSNTCQFTGLVEGRNYTIKVEVQDNAGNIGIKEESIQVKDDIAPVVTLDITGKTSNSITAKASATDVGGMPATPTYVFYIKKTGEPDTSYVQIQSSTSTTCTFTGLQTDTDYTIKVTVQDDAGNEGIKEASCLTDKIPDGTEAGAIIFSNITWTSGKATVTISTNTNYTIEYQVNSISGTWVAGTIVNNLNHGDVIYARLTDGINATSPATCNIVDSIKPQVTLSLTSAISNVTATATATDNESGIGTTATYKFSIKKVSEPDTSYVVKQNTTSNTCTITGLLQDTDYIVKVEVQDIAGNVGQQSQTTKTQKMPDATTTGAISFSPVTWASGKASTTISTNTSYGIEYQVNSTTGTWVAGTNVTNLNHGDVVYARLTDGTNASNYVTLNVVDTVAPESFTITVSDVTGDGVTVSGSTTDNQAGLASYTYVVEDTTGTKIKEITGKTVTTYKVTGLTGNTEYVVYMIAVDKAGNTTISNKETIKTNKVPTDIYAKLYTDGTLALSSTDVTMSDKTLQTDYGNVKNYNGSKWNNDASSILEAVIIDEIVPTTCLKWFYNCKNLTNIVNIKNLDTSKVIDMTGMFMSCEKLINLDVSNFDTTNVKSMKSMFANCTSLTELNVSNFNTSNVSSMAAMFSNVKELLELNITNFDTSNVTEMQNMFEGCASLKRLNVSNFDTSKVSNMTYMFGACYALTELDLSSFNTGNVKFMTGMFDRCRSLTELDLRNFDTSNVIYMNSMFKSCASLRSLNITTFNTNKVSNMRDMFCFCENLTTLDLRSFYTTNATNMISMFERCGRLTSILVSSKWKTSGQSSYMFNGCGVSKVTVVN